MSFLIENEKLGIKTVFDTVAEFKKILSDHGYKFYMESQEILDPADQELLLNTKVISELPDGTSLDITTSFILNEKISETVHNLYGAIKLNSFVLGGKESFFQQLHKDFLNYPSNWELLAEDVDPDRHISEVIGELFLKSAGKHLSSTQEYDREGVLSNPLLKHVVNKLHNTAYQYMSYNVYKVRKEVSIFSVKV